MYWIEKIYVNNLNTLNIMQKYFVHDGFACDSLKQSPTSMPQFPPKK